MTTILTGTFAALSGFLFGFTGHNDALIEKQIPAIQKTFAIIAKTHSHCQRLREWPKANTGTMIKREMQCLSGSLYYETELAIDTKTRSYMFGAWKNAVDLSILNRAIEVLKKLKK